MMEIKMQGVGFTASQQLREFVEKKVSKLERFHPDLINADVVLTLVKPDVAMNKKARITLSIKGPDLFSEKVADTFEEALTEACEALESQIKKLKEKK